MAIVHNAIISKECKGTKLWEKTKWDEKLHASIAKKEEKEEQEAIEMAKEMGVYDELFGDKKKEGSDKGAKAKKRKGWDGQEDEDFSALQNIIAKRNEQRGGQIDGLIAKLEADAKKAKGAKKKKGSAKADEEKEQHEPSEEQFEKIRAQLDASKSKKQKKA
jgi:DnaJ family protein C protein 9